MENIKKSLGNISRMISEMDHDDIPTLGKILNELESLGKNLPKKVDQGLVSVLLKVRDYIEAIVLGEKHDFSPVNEGLVLLKAMVRHEARGEDFSFEYDDVIEMLDKKEIEKAPLPEPEQESCMSSSRGAQPLDQEDFEILRDFIIESRENLETIEINLIDLEENPEDREIIDAIFRPFHTVKGISGFLDLRKINVLSHATENLLDSARKGKFVMDHEVTDVILLSVDMLKQMIDLVEKGLEQGLTADDTDIDIGPLVKKIENLDSKERHVERPRKIGEILVDAGALDSRELEEALEIQKADPEKKIGEILVKVGDVESKEVISALREQKRAKRPGSFQVKVDTSKLDNLVDLTGELVIAQSMLRQNTGIIAADDQKLNQNLSQLGQIVSNIQKISMSMRMVPIGTTFQKMVRLVRDLSRSCKKDVALTMSGEDTEIDRNVVEALYEPMVHMIRNSIDHGLESKEERVRAGKPEKGHVSLSAFHKGGNIVIEINDDGRGLNTVQIFEKAMKLGLVDADTILDDSDIFKLIMKPGFSTAKEITDISGRGVGMDVVKQGIESLSGRVDIQSVEGQGSTFIITLPLTLAIIEGMLVRVGNERFIVPTMAILESFKPEKSDYFTVEGREEMIMFRKSLIPVIRLNRICHVAMDHGEVWNNIAIVVENNKKQRALLIDELLGKEEYVIKSLGESLKNIKGLAGGAILGDGKVGLILDIAGLFDVAANMQGVAYLGETDNLNTEIRV